MLGYGSGVCCFLNMLCDFLLRNQNIYQRKLIYADEVVTSTTVVVSRQEDDISFETEEDINHSQVIFCYHNITHIIIILLSFVVLVYLYYI